MKKFVSLLFALILVFTLCACGAKDDGKTTTIATTTAQPDTTQTTAIEKTTAIDTTTAPLDTTKITATEKTTKSQAEIDKIIDGIRKAVVLSSVLDKYGSYMLDSGTFETGDLHCLFRRNGKIAQIWRSTVASNFLEEIYYGYYDGTLFNYSVGNQRPNAVFDLDIMGLDLADSLTESVDEKRRIFDPDDFSCFMLIEETDDSYIFSIDEEVTDTSNMDFGVYKIDKETLLPVKEFFSNANYYNFEYGVDVEHYEKMIDDWQGKLRKVTVVKEYVKDGELVTEEATVEIPATWELEIRYDYYDPFHMEPSYIIYMDAAHTVEYSYPGDGVDYTVYASQIYDGLIN